MISPWTWIVLAIIFGIIELFSFELTTCWFLIGALVAFVAAWLGLSWSIQVVVFLFTAIMLLIFFRPLAKDYFKVGAIRTNVPALIGEIGIVKKEIVPYEGGEITVHGQVWSAESVDNEIIEVNKNVEIIGIEGVVLKVQRLK